MLLNTLSEREIHPAAAAEAVVELIVAPSRAPGVRSYWLLKVTGKD